MPRPPLDAPIGIFDSGFGGLTVARSVIDQLPHESLVYLGDTARQPYGPKPIGEVREYALECLDHLVDEGVKALVIACNSASAAMLRDARERYDVPVVEVILPATRRAVAATRNGRIGVICTRATAESLAYDDAFAAAPHVELPTRACPRFVEFVEAGVTGGDELLAVAHDYLDPLVEAGVDTLILGCTHYPLLTGVISYVMGDEVTLVSSAEECAKDVYKLLVGERPDARRRRPVVPLPHHRRRPTSSSTSAAASSAPSSRWPPSSPAAGVTGMRLTVIGCSGSFAGPDSAASCYLLEADDADGRTWRILLDLGSGCARRAAAVRRPGRHRRGASSATCTPTTAWTSAATTCCASTTPAAPCRRIPVWGPVGVAAADGARLRPARPAGMTSEFDFHEYDGPVEVGPFRGRAGPGGPPGAGVTACG